MNPNAETVSDLLRETGIEVVPATFVLVGLSHQNWTRLLENPELSPRAESPFLIFRDGREVTLLLEENDWQRIRHLVRDARIERGFRLVTLDIELPWNVVGYLARVTEILAANRIPVGALSSFSRDHLLIRQDDLGRALRVLSAHVKEICEASRAPQPGCRAGDPALVAAFRPAKRRPRKFIGR